MNVVYALFERYPDAREEVGELLDREYDQSEMNAIVQAHVAKEYMDLDLESVSVRVTDAVGERTARGFDPFLAAQMPAPVPGLGEMYAAGEPSFLKKGHSDGALATVMVKTAIAHGGGIEGLQFALNDAVPVSAAHDFAAGVSRGGVLFWIRTHDERDSAAMQTLRRHGGKYVDDYVD